MSTEETGVTQDLPEGESAAETPAIEEAPATGTEATPEEPESPAEPEPEAPKQVPWFQKRIDALTREKHDERRRVEMLEKTLAELGTGKAEETAAQPANVDQLVAQRVEEAVRKTQFDTRCNEVYSSGKEEFGDFDATIDNFRQLGGLNPTVLDAVTQLPDAHKVLYALGKDMDEADRINNLPPVPMALALAKLSMSPAKTRPVSNAPAPIRPIDGTPKGQLDPEDMSTDEWIKWREGELKGST
jgi:hypothetical protein